MAAREDTNTMADFDIIQTDDANLISVRESGDMGWDQRGIGNVILGEGVRSMIPVCKDGSFTLILGCDRIDIDDDERAGVWRSERFRGRKIESVRKRCGEWGWGE